MMQARLALNAFRNMLRHAARDPVWAFVNVMISPIRAAQYFYQVGLGFIVIAILLLVIPLSLPVTWVMSRWIVGAVVSSIIFVLAFRLLTNPLIQQFGNMQDIHQLRATYGQRAGTFLSNAGVLQVFGVNDHETARLVSDMLGQSTVVFESMGRAPDSEKTGISYGEQHVGRPLLTPDEVRNLPANVELLFLSG